MKDIRRKLTRTINLFTTACGYEESVQKAWRNRDELEFYIEKKLNEMAGGK